MFNVVSKNFRFLSYSFVFSMLLAPSASFADVTQTCREANSSPSGCFGHVPPQCRDPQTPCDMEAIYRGCVESAVQNCINARTATATYIAKYNTAAADFNFLELLNSSKEKDLVGVVKIYDIAGSIVGKPIEFDINARGRHDVDIHSLVGKQVFGQIEISIFSSQDSFLGYTSFYNQRARSTATGVFLDQTVSVKAEKSNASAE